MTETQKQTVYAVYEVTPNSERLRAIFPDTDEGVEEAIAWGETNFDRFSAAKSGSESTGEAFLKKAYGVYIGGIGTDKQT